MRIERDIINKFKEWKDAEKPVAIYGLSQRNKMIEKVGVMI